MSILPNSHQRVRASGSEAGMQPGHAHLRWAGGGAEFFRMDKIQKLNFEILKGAQILGSFPQVGGWLVGGGWLVVVVGW